MKSNSQSRKYHVVINNPITAGMTRDYILAELNKLSLDYYCLADEIASTGTLHTHIYLYSASPIRFSTIKNRFPIAHVERAYGSSQDNKNYILKQDKWANTDKAETVLEGTFYEYGEVPSTENEKAPEMSRLLEWVNEGLTTAEIIKRNPKYAFRINEINNLRETLLSEKYMLENRDVEVIYIYGDTGTGKTSSVYQNHSPADICRITSYSANGVRFDAYHGHDVLVYEEFHSQVPLPEMLSYLDIYPIMLPARYNDRVACFSTVYILSNIPLTQQYMRERENDPDTWDAFLRRITKVYRQVSFGEVIEEKEATR